MAPSTPRLRILSVGGNAVSAFLSWRLQATNACDVTLVWKSEYEYVSQYGINWLTNDGKERHRFKPHATVRTPEEAAQSQNSKTGPFDYVLLCIKALPDVYDMASVIESVVAPQHTCILLNTTNSLGVESYLEQRFPSNVLLSLVCAADLAQMGPAEFEHRGDCSDIWVGWVNKNATIPTSIQKDMAEALAMTLTTGGVQCSVSENIRQQQFEKMIGPIAFYPASVIFDTPNHNELLEKTGVRPMIYGVIDELVALGKALGCTFPAGYRDRVVQQMLAPGPQDKNSFMYTDYVQRRPMEVETYLGSPIKLASEVNVQVPRIETLYAMLHYKNTTNMNQPAAASAPGQGPQSPAVQNLPPRTSSVAGPGPRPVMNGSMPNGGARRAPSSMGGPPPPNMRRGPPNGYGGRMPNGNPNGFPPNGPHFGNRRPSMDGNDLQEFSHVMLYDNMPEQDGGPGGAGGVYNDGAMGSSTSDLAIRERELAIRARELELRERQMNMNRRRGPPPQGAAFGDDDDEDDDFFDPMENHRPNPAVLDENFDMMSVTSRRNRKTPSNSMDRFNGPPARGRNLFGRQKNRTSARLMQDVPGLHESIMSNALMGYSSNRYGSVDRQAMGQESRQNSLTRAKLDELQGNMGGGAYGAYPTMQRRASQSPGNPLGPALNGPGNGPAGMKRPSPPNGANGYGPPNGMPNGVPNGRPSPPNGMMRQPVPRHPPGLGNAVAPYQVEQQAGVSRNPLKISPQVRSLTGSASASAGSGESAHLDSDPSANSSQSSFAIGARPRPNPRP